MTEALLAHEPAIRLTAFLGIFAVMAGWEIIAPRRALTVSKGLRWRNNLGLVILNTVVLRLLFPTAAVGWAASNAALGMGLLPQTNMPETLRVIIAVVVLDGAIYLQHVMFHAVPALWRLHRVHHADLDFDVTTGARFHPLEIVLSMLIKFAVIMVLGPPAVAVLVFEVLLNATAMFNHSNICLPGAIDNALRYLLVTPDMHRIHHSIETDEANSNFGFNLSLWDRLLGTYRVTPAASHETMTIGLQGYREIQQVERLPGVLALPFVGPAGSYVINSRGHAPARKERL